ncbi:MAG TPA: hypothetical protein VFO25_04475 [Candidatus Eremiobacteraceae bacterium]|nr:hypothetical protein [Candidatus Eremiobacteraceae bacterium]
MQFLIACLAAFVIAPTPAAQSASSPPPDLKNMMVYGEGFAFWVREPDGWVGHAPSDVGVGNASFYKSGETARNATTIIWVQVMDYDGPDVAGDLTADMGKWKTKYPNISFEDFAASNPEYKTFAKLYLIPGEDPSYAVYVDPGPAVKLYFIVSMQPIKRRAIPDEMAALEEVVASLRWMSSTVYH